MSGFRRSQSEDSFSLETSRQDPLQLRDASTQPGDDSHLGRAGRAPLRPGVFPDETSTAPVARSRSVFSAQMPPPGPFISASMPFRPASTPPPRSASRRAAASRVHNPSHSPSPSPSPGPSASRVSAPYADMTPDARFLAALGYLDGIGGVGALLHRVLNYRAEPVFQTHAYQFYRSGYLSKVLDVCWQDNFGKDRLLEWMQPKASELAVAKVAEEMEEVKRACLKRAKDYTVQELMEFRLETVILPLMQRKGPFTLRIIEAAVETERGLLHHKKKSSRNVSIASLRQNKSLRTLCRWRA
jgi:hypothetical protein